MPSIMYYVDYIWDYITVPGDPDYPALRCGTTVTSMELSQNPGLARDEARQQLAKENLPEERRSFTLTKLVQV